jgi:hypothetical protein
VTSTVSSGALGPDGAADAPTGAQTRKKSALQIIAANILGRMLHLLVPNLVLV